VDTVPAIARDSLAGSAYLAGTVRGGAKHFDLRGRGAFDKVVVNGNVIRRGSTEYSVVNGGTPQMAVAAALSLDHVQAAGFQLDSVDARLAYAKPHGHVELAIRQDSGVSYALRAD